MAASATTIASSSSSGLNSGMESELGAVAVAGTVAEAATVEAKMAESDAMVGSKKLLSTPSTSTCTGAKGTGYGNGGAGEVGQGRRRSG
jgi:hypothetical protein